MTFCKQNYHLSYSLKGQKFTKRPGVKKIYFIKPWKLSRFDPDKWGVSVCTVDGQRFTLGDVNEPFTIQSCSKPFTYGINVDKLGQEVVDKYIGQEPSGRDFNEICLDSKSQFLLNYLCCFQTRKYMKIDRFNIFLYR